MIGSIASPRHGTWRLGCAASSPGKSANGSPTASSGQNAPSSSRPFHWWRRTFWLAIGTESGWTRSRPRSSRRGASCPARCCRGTDQGGLKSAAKYLNQTGLKPRRAKAFTRQTVMQTLTSDASSTIFTPVERVRIKEALQPKEERNCHGRNATRLLAGGILRCGGCDRPLYIGTRAVRRKDPNAEPVKQVSLISRWLSV
jgi:hypothetical protein